MGAFLVAVTYGGLVAVAIAATTVGYVVAPLYFLAVKRLALITVGEYARHLATPLITAAAVAGGMFGLSYLLRDTSAVVILIVVASAGAVAYAGAIRVFAPALAGEVRDLARRALPTPRVARSARASAKR